MKELGYDLEFYLWVGLFAPKGTPEPTSRRSATFSKAATTPKFKEADGQYRPGRRLQDQAEFKAFWDADAKRVEDAVRTIGRVEG